MLLRLLLEELFFFHLFPEEVLGAEHFLDVLLVGVVGVGEQVVVAHTRRLLLERHLCLVELQIAVFQLFYRNSLLVHQLDLPH